ncbi:MAG: biotin transporter BioY [Proteobacteria bacterium]|nr:biotin transporter BioY [Pseudomonadota bacterium]
MRMTNGTLVGAALGEDRAGFATQVLLVLAATGLLAVSAKVQVPFWPVPMTMQSLVVLVIGAAFGWRLGAATVLAYLAEGAMGLPVFAGAGAGAAYMAGPTGGYLAGFVLAAAITGFLAEKGYTRSVPGALAVMAIGHAVLFVPGYLWLATLVGTEKAYHGGVEPFYYATLLKTALGAALLPAAWWAVGKIRRA